MRHRIERRSRSDGKREILIIGAGPAGLAASIEAAKTGAKVLLVDENDTPGGQLFKQIHKFLAPQNIKREPEESTLAGSFLSRPRRLG